MSDSPGAAHAREANRASMALNGHPLRGERKTQPPMQGTTERQPMQDKRAIFDPTINLGHILTAVAMLAAGFTAYSTVERRLAVVEERQAAGARASDERAQETKDTIREIRQDVKDVQKTVNELARVVTRRADRQ